ncbi:MAG: CxxxxCH/CxxCH domain-containing protein [Planctomycetes bacterium]|nr:CxxxxCH/CxxCH domain-containing protein [Planctomycetota bacterium]
MFLIRCHRNGTDQGLRQVPEWGGRDTGT